jgi:asparagine synthase (glutamine-hydrolysing)
VSGICGIYNLDGRPADPDSLLRMTNALAHRGPDGIGRTILGSVGIGQLVLQTGRESVGDRHPATNEHRKICLTFDGRLDNATALKEELERNGIPIIGDSDAEIVLGSYQCWGENFPIHLLGDFAFALWDGQIRRLFCARDYVGVRPFYYYPGPSLFAFASEIRALLALESVPRRLNESRLVDFLVESLDREDKEATFYRDILRLPAGHSLTVSARGLVIKNYWNLKAPATLRLRSLQEYGDAFREVFVEAVRCRLRSNHRVASTLSGGIDSSSVVCAARELLATERREPLHTISLVDADQDRCGETPYIREVIEGGRLVPHILRSHQLDGLEGAMAEADEPFEIGRYFLNRFLFSTCRSAGARVLLDGISGDHIIPPYHYLGILIKSLAWKMLYSEL